jgi:hypothetical protein
MGSQCRFAFLVAQARLASRPWGDLAARDVFLEPWVRAIFEADLQLALAADLFHVAAAGFSRNP